MRHTVDALASGPLVVDRVVLGTGAIEQDAPKATELTIDVLDTAFLFAKLLMLTGLAGAQGKEERTAIALGAVAVGMLELVGGMHAQTAHAQGTPSGSKVVLVTLRKGTAANPPGAQQV